MSGRVRKQQMHGESTTVGKGGVKTFTDYEPDGARVDYHGMELRAAAEARARGDAGDGFGEPWNEGSRAKFDVDGNKGVGQGGHQGQVSVTKNSTPDVPRGGPAPVSGSEILDYQEPMEMNRRAGRSRSVSRDSQDVDG